MKLRDRTFLGTTTSLCPECLAVVPAKILARGERVYFEKRCPTHGVREDFVCSDVRHFDRMEYSLPGKLPPVMGVEPDKGCPLDCGLCTEHEQHTCIGLVEITTSCNLECPMCYASSGPGGKHQSFEDCAKAIDRLVETEVSPEIVQLSGGEPTIHPEFTRILDHACSRPFQIVMINTNGLRIAKDPKFVEALAKRKDRLEVYLQFDGLTDDVYRRLRGEPLLDLKLRAVEALGAAGIHTILVSTLHPGVNEHQLGELVRFGLERPWVTGVSFQPATYSGRHVLPEDLDRRITFPDVVKGIAAQTDGMFREADFLPLPCAHPNCHSLTYAFRTKGRVVPLPRFLDAKNHLDLLANGITFSKGSAKELIEKYLDGLAGCGGGCGPYGLPVGEHAASSLPPLDAETQADAEEFFTRALAQQLSPRDVFRITITSFLDAYNFDVRRVMKCCIHHVLPSGHIVPFCAYNVLYRDGHVPLPPLRATGKAPATTSVGGAVREPRIG